MPAPPFALPLSPAQFVSALHKGHGRALMHIRAFGVSDLEGYIVDACLHDRAYDPQCEGDRTGWLMELIDASGEATRISDSLVHQFDSATDSFWDITQRCRIARRLAQRGHADARHHLYASLRKWPDDMSVIGEEDIIALDGADGLLHVAEYSGTLLQQLPDFWADDNLLRCFDETHGPGSGRRVLDSAASHSPRIAEYLRHLDQREEERRSVDIAPDSGGYLDVGKVQFEPSGPDSHRKRMQRTSGSAIVQEIETSDPQKNRFWFTSWGVHAPESDLAVVFEAMISQLDPGRLCKYLRVFIRRALPSFDPRLLQYADHEHEYVRQLGYKALSQYAHPDVRRLALERLGAGRILENELELLKKNYSPGDEAIIARALRVPDDRDQLHGVVYDLVDIGRLNQVIELSDAMLFVYEESPCSNCREDAVKFLISRGKAPAWLLEESRHDSSEEIRAIAASATPSP